MKLYAQHRLFKTSKVAALLLALSVMHIAGAQDHVGIDEARRLNSLVTQISEKGHFSEAIPYSRKALEIVEHVRGPEHPDTATLLENLASLYENIRDLDQAEPLYRRALTIREKSLGPEHPLTADSLSLLAGVYLERNDYTHAEALILRALAIKKNLLGAEHPDIAYLLNRLAVIYLHAGSYDRAEPLIRSSLNIREATLGTENAEIATSLNNLAEIYRITGAYAKTEPLYLRALEIKEKSLGPHHPYTANTLNNLALLYQSTGAYTKAEPLLQRAIAINEIFFGGNDLKTASSLHNLSELYLDTGAYAQAIPIIERVLAIQEMAAGPEHPITAAALNTLARIYEKTGRITEAEPLLQRAIAINNAALGPTHPDTATALNNLATLYATSGTTDKASQMYEQAQAIAELNTSRFMLSGAEARKRAYLQQQLGQVQAHVSFSLSVADPRAKALGLAAVLQYKGRVLDAMSNSVAQIRRSTDPEDQALFDKLASLAQQLSTLTFRGPGKLPAQAYRDRIDALAREQEQLQTELAGRSAALRAAITPITLDAVRKALPADRALVEWFRYLPFDAKAKDRKTRWGAPRYVAYVLRSEGEPAVVDLGSAQEIDKLVSDFRAALSNPKSTFYPQVATELFGKLIVPLQSALGSTERLFISPDGELNLVPFAALMDEQGEFLVQRFELTYLTSGRDLLSLASVAPARSGAMVMADPAYGLGAGMEAPANAAPPATINRSGDLDRSGLVFKPLAGTSAEAKALQRLLKLRMQDVLTGEQASEGKLKALHGPRMLHVATHGFFLSDQELAAMNLSTGSIDADIPALPLGENPLLRSGLALAGANTRRSGEDNDGILTAAEVAELDLLGTQLVVLSACQTGEGQVQQGEGVYGLRRALVLAGAQAQIVSLWKVADDQTKNLMVDYYQRLLKGEGRSVALRNAQQAMLAKPDTHHPYFWAAFVPIGAWTPLQAMR